MTSIQNARTTASCGLSFNKQAVSRWLSAGLCAWGVVASTAATAAPVKVAIINGSSGTMGVADVAAQLNDDSYFDFTATVLSGGVVSNVAALSGYNVVLLGGSGNSNIEYSSSTLSAVLAFMQTGGGVVTAGWYRYGAISAANQAAADAITPVVTGQGYDYGYNTTLHFGGALHDITAGVSDFAVPGCCVEVASALDVGATSLATADGKSAVAYQNSVGRSVYLGSLYTANPSGYNVASLRSGSADRLLEQSVNWAANSRTALSANANVPEPGSLALVLAALAGVGLVRRRA